MYPCSWPQMPLPVTRANWHLPALRSLTAISIADRLELQPVSTVSIGPLRPKCSIRWPARVGTVVPYNQSSSTVQWVERKLFGLLLETTSKWWKCKAGSGILLTKPWVGSSWSLQWIIVWQKAGKVQSCGVIL